MADQARIQSIDTLVTWRSSLIAFQSKARRGVNQVTEEAKRTRLWLENEQRPFWEMQIKKRSRMLDQAQQELISARLSSLRENLMVQEQAVRKAKARLQEADDKLRRTKHWCREFDRVVGPMIRKLENVHFYLEHELPKGIIYLQQIMQTLEGYTQSTLKEPDATASDSDAGEASS